VGNRLQSAGYHAAYLGKWHMSEAMEDIELRNVPDVNMEKLNQVMQEHGFQDYVGVGDIIGLTLGGYRTDEFTASTAVRWLRAEPPKLAEKDKPWFLAVNFVNPHDVMFFNTDGPGETAQQGARHAMPLNREPAHTLYQRRWDMALPESRKEAWDYPGRPRAHYEYQYARQALVGQFPNEDARWRRLQDYYLNCNADCDRHVERLLVELDDLGLADNTIVILTSDHGELGGAHGMHGKGSTAYKEQNQVPLWIRHPAHGRDAGKESRAVTSHLDLAPTILGFAGVDAKRRASLAPEMKGHDLSGLLAAPELAETHAVRDDALYNMNMWLYQDSEFLNQAVAAKLAGKDVKSMGLELDLTKRGAIRSINTGSYRYTRYFSPLQHNLPRTLEEIFAYNDVELFDLEADPNEMNNLAVDRKKNGELLLAMNERMTRLINDEVGDDDGQYLPENKAGWAVTNFDP
jgi:arylsulfatase